MLKNYVWFVVGLLNQIKTEIYRRVRCLVGPSWDTPTEARVKAVIFEDCDEMTYNLHVDRYNNFSVNGGLIVHNSIKASMYALEPLSRSQGKPGVLSGSINEQKKDLIKAKALQRQKFKEVIKARREEKKALTKSK